MNCPNCGAALAEDQRYCLNCGKRQGEPRVDFRQHLESKPAAGQEPPPAGGTAVAPAAGSGPAQKPQRDYAPLAAAGGIAVLGIMLLIGVLIGRGTGGDNDSASAPQVVTVGAAAPSSNAADEGGSTGGAGKDGKNDQGGGKAKKKNTASEQTDTGNAPVASSGQLEALQGKTGQEYAEESAKLPDEIATEGEPPPTDNKKPGGDSGGGVTLE